MEQGPFQVWISSLGGPDGVVAGQYKLADALGVAPMTVQYWYYRYGRPKATLLLRILELAGGQLTFKDVMTSTEPLDKKAKAKPKKKIN